MISDDETETNYFSKEPLLKVIVVIRTLLGNTNSQDRFAIESVSNIGVNTLLHRLLFYGNDGYFLIII